MSIRTIIDVSILQTVPPSNLNRDDTGSPKSAIYGGVPRARVSSQAWKRPTRQAFRDTVDPQQLGIRTKRVAELLAARIVEQAPGTAEADAVELAQEILKAGGLKLTAPRRKTDDTAPSDEVVPEQTGYLFFLGARQYARLAELAAQILSRGDSKAGVKDHKKQIKAILKEDHAIDVALFGRMVADDTDLNVDAAAQVAHAISVHRVDAEADYFTAVDDAKQASEEESDAGAAMIGTVEFNSSTLYRYANVDADRLFENVDDIAATRTAVEAFVRSFATSIPNGKINTFAHGTLPDLILVSLRDTQPVNLVGAFERPVTGTDRVQEATERLVEREQQIDETYGTTPVQSWVVRIGDETAAADAIAPHTSLAEAVTEIGETVEQRLTESTAAAGRN